MTKFSRFIDDRIREYGTAGQLAEMVGMSLSAFSRGVRLEDTLGLEKLLRLAEAVGTRPSELLRIAHKASAADIIERLYGPERSALSNLDRELLALDPHVKQQLLNLVRGLKHHSKNGKR